MSIRYDKSRSLKSIKWNVELICNPVDRSLIRDSYVECFSNTDLKIHLTNYANEVIKYIYDFLLTEIIDHIPDLTAQ